MNQVATTNEALKQLTTDVNVGMNEVVSVFVSKYEDALFQKKDQLSDSIRDLKKDLADLDKTIIAQAPTAQYEVELPEAFGGLCMYVDDVRVYWKDAYHTKANTFDISVVFGQKSPKSRETTKSFSHDISEEHIAKHKQLEQDLATATAELAVVMNDIRSVGRKERQIRGKISELKLQESGMMDLLNNSDLQLLIAVQ